MENGQGSLLFDVLLFGILLVGVLLVGVLLVGVLLFDLLLTDLLTDLLLSDLLLGILLFGRPLEQVLQGAGGTTIPTSGREGNPIARGFRARPRHFQAWGSRARSCRRVLWLAGRGRGADRLAAVLLAATGAAARGLTVRGWAEEA